MKFNGKHHINRDQLSAMFGISPQHITQIMQKKGGPPEIGIIDVRDPGSRVQRKVRFYRREEAVQWLEHYGHRQVSRPSNPVPPRQINAMQGQYKPSPGLSLAMARADAAYEGRGFVSAGGVGNGVERAHGYARGT